MLKRICQALLSVAAGLPVAAGPVAAGLVSAGIVALPTPAWAENWDPESEADNYASGWGRVDVDRVGAEVWLGTTFSLGSLHLATNLVATQLNPEAVDPKMEPAMAARLDNVARAPVVRLELGPAFSTGGLFLLPKVGLGYDFEREKIAPLVPQLMTILQGGPLYVESWLQFFLNDMFDEGAQDSFYTQDHIVVALDNHWAFGAQVELTTRLNTPAPVPTRGKVDDAKLRSLSVGPRALWSPLEALTFAVYVGYETQKVARPSKDDFIAARVTATVLW